jgi:hypothetical protein
MYMPTLARFMSRDPVREDGVDLLYPPPELDPYRYVHNNPVNLSDPSGLACPPCPVPWKAQPVGGVVFQYGCFCGREAPPFRVPPLPAPLDPIDVCCLAHDTCCAVAPNNAARTVCNATLCTCAKAAQADCAVSAPDIKCCCDAARKVAGLYCAVMGPEFC